MITKNSILSGSVTEQGKKGEGIVWHEDMPVYIPNCIPGDVIEFKVIKVDKRRAFGRLEAVQVASLDRVVAKCSIASQCGGCQLQHQIQSAQVTFKSDALISRLSRFVDLRDVAIAPMLFGDSEWATRNKMQFAFSMGLTGLEIGLYAPRSHRVINVDYCEVMAKSMNHVLNAIRDWHRQHSVAVFDELTGNGLLRHVSIRYSYVTGQLMLILTIADPFDMTSFIDVMAGVEGMHSIYVSYQADPKNDQVLGERMDHVWGEPSIEDVINGVRCQVSPETFMQANAMLVNTLYETIMQSLPPKGVMVDLYCGSGVLTCGIAKHYDQVIGVDNNPAAILDATLNAKKNEVNVTFKCMDVGVFLQSFSEDQMTIIVDPPRQGLAVVDALIKTKAQHMIYVSCYPDTLGRDLRDLVAGGYVIVSIQGVDMFCHTPHIECVVVLEYQGISS